MSWPRLPMKEVEKLANLIFGAKSFQFLSDLYELFYEKNPNTIFSSFSKRFEKLCESKSKMNNLDQQSHLLAELYFQVLNYFKDQKLIEEVEYSKEMKKCQEIWDKFFLRKNNSHNETP
ncbi:hypothetical protein H5T58_01595 [Candidatus Parcubacteria bacterium]|nr:hypothetical protein [Candidatus Parcubacteria bacterium]